MLTPSLYIGIGGTGTRTLLSLKKRFIDDYGEVPPIFKFLALDTDSTSRSLELLSSSGEVIRLSNSEILFCNDYQAQAQIVANPNCFSWLPERSKTMLSYGAHFASLGHYISVIHYLNITNLITLCAKEIVESFHDELRPINIHVITSVAGGTGSGMLIDVICSIKESFETIDVPYEIIPWIVLPDVFKITNTPGHINRIYGNAYSVLSVLDYIQHHNPNEPDIRYGNRSISCPLFSTSYFLNIDNDGLFHLDQLVYNLSASVWAVSHYQLFHRYRDSTTFQMYSGLFDIRNKKAWCESIGSAELIYDARAVGHAFAYRILSQLCDLMLQPSNDGMSNADRFFNDQDVLISEDKDHHDIIDYLMSPYLINPFEIDEKTTKQDINSYIALNYVRNIREPEIKEHLEKKLSNTEKHLEIYLERILTRPTSNVDAAISFIESLKVKAKSCEDKLIKDIQEYHTLNSKQEQWDILLSGIKNRGILGIFKKTNQKRIEILQAKIHNLVTYHREEMRRQWGQKFYVSFKKILDRKLQRLYSLKIKLSELSKKNTDIILNYHYSQSSSKFQLYIHETDMNNALNFNVDQSIKAAFEQHLVNGASKWMNMSDEFIERELWSFTTTLPIVKEAFQKTIDEALAEMPENKIKSYIIKLKELASPLWTYDTRGFLERRLDLFNYVMVGVCDKYNSVLCLNEELSHCFDINGCTASFESTYARDRIVVTIEQGLLPLYCVYDIPSYFENCSIKNNDPYIETSCLDVDLKKRMIAEGYQLFPIIDQDDALKYWVLGFIFGFIHFDSADNQYWMRSKKRGDALENYRFNLSHQRDAAFDMFKSEFLYKEIETAMNTQIAKSGRLTMEAKIEEVKSECSYLDSYAQLSPLEASNIDQPEFKNVRDLVNQEIRLIDIWKIFDSVFKE